MAIVELILAKDFAATGTIEFSTTSSTGPWTSYTLTADAPLREALADWTTQINAAITPEVVDLSWDTLPKVQFAGTVPMWLRMPACMAWLFGFSVTVIDESSVSDLTPMGIVEIPVGQSFPFDVEEAELTEYRAARASAYAYGRAIETRLRLFFTPALWTEFEATPLGSGHGAFKVTWDNADPWGEDDLDGAITVYPIETTEIAQEGSDYEATVGLRATMLDPGTTVAAVRATAYGEAMGATRYAYAPQYVVKVEGDPTLLVEYIGDAVAPAGHELDASLVIDKSSRVGCVVDPRTHVAAGFDLELRLLDTEAVRGLMVRPTRFATLRTDAAYNDTSFAVRDVIGDWSASDDVYIGTSLETKTGEGAGTFTGLTRGTYGRQRGYKAGTVLADKIVEWKGRRVELYLVMRDPSGAYVQGADILSSAVKLWDGTIQARPERDGTEWVIACRDQVRRLTQPLGVAASGQAVWGVDDDGLVAVDPEAVVYLSITVDTTDFARLTIKPFVGLGSPYRKSYLRAVIVSALESELVARGVTAVHDLAWRRVGGPDLPGQFNDVFALYASVDVASTDAKILAIGSFASSQLMARTFLGSTATTITLGTTTTLSASLGLSSPTTVGSVSLSVLLDEGDATVLPTAGWVSIEGNGKTAYKAYTGLTVDDVDPTLVHLQLDDSTTISVDDIMEISGDQNVALGQRSDVGVKFYWRDSGKVYDVLRRAISSTGDGVNGAYDTLPKGQGLGLADVDDASFEEVFDGFYRDLDAAIGTEAGTSLQDVFGGLMRLSQRALVSRRATDGSTVGIAAVGVGSVDSLPVATITDATLVAARGQRPVRPVALFAAPQAIEVKCRTLAIDDAPAGEGMITLKDPHLVDWTSEAWTLDIYGFARSAILGPAKAWGIAWFRAGENRQVIELDVPAWIDAQAGDVVDLDLDDPNLWDYATGTPGVHSLARVIGAQVSLTSAVQTLTVVVDGILAAGPMSPSLPIVAVNGGATTPSSIDVDDAYLDLLTAAKDGNASWKVLAYLPGQDAGRAEYTVSTVTSPGGGVTRLTVTAYPSAPSVTLTTDYRLTWPIQAECTTAQGVYLHNTDGTQWG